MAHNDESVLKQQLVQSQILEQIDAHQEFNGS